MAKKSNSKESANVSVSNSGKVINLFSGVISGKDLRHEQSETKKAVKSILMAYAPTLESELTKVIKSDDKRARNLANAVKGKYRTAIEVVSNCFPYQDKDGNLCAKGKDKDGNKVWQLKKLTAVTARGIIKDSLNNFVKFVGKPEITVVTVGTVVE